MGDDTDPWSDNPEHRVTLSGFCMDSTEVTQAAYGTNPNGYTFSGATLPAEHLSWQEASDHCTGLGKRLPTEAEWEYAARNGGTAPVNAYATGSTTTPTCSTVNALLVAGGCVGQTSAVGSYPASDSGLYDMVGNVWEWIGDRYSPSYYANGQTNPTGPSSGDTRVLRGQSWTGFSVDSATVPMRASYRDYDSPSYRATNIGFRCASN